MSKENLLEDINYMSNYIKENEELLSLKGIEKLDYAFLKKDDLNEELDENSIELLEEVNELYIELQCALEDYECEVENDLILSQEQLE